MKTLTTLCVLFATLILSAQTASDSLTSALQEIQTNGSIPGIGVALVNADGIIYKNGFGFSDIESQTPYSPQTIQNIGSVSKTFIGLAVMQLVVEGKLNLNTPINEILPFSVSNPHHPEVPITIAHLAKHTSSLLDTEHIYDRSYVFSEKMHFKKDQVPAGYFGVMENYNSNVHIPMDVFLKKTFHEDGEWYSKKNFTKKAPGTAYEYSNMGAALAAQAVEVISGMTFDAYTQKHILAPLGMNHSGWRHAAVDMTTFSTLYLSNLTEIPPYELNTYPDGGFISSIEDLSLYLSSMIKSYQVGTDLLSKEAALKLITPEFISEEENGGIFWSQNKSGLYGHTGGDPGITSFLFFNHETGIGRIMFINQFAETKEIVSQLRTIWTTMGAFENAINEE